MLARYIDIVLLISAVLAAALSLFTMSVDVIAILVLISAVAYYLKKEPEIFAILVLSLPLFDSTALLPAALLLAFRLSPKSFFEHLFATRLLLFCYLCWSLRLAYLEWDIFLSEQFNFERLRLATPDYILRFESYLRWFVFFLLFALFQKQVLRKRFWNGALIGTGIILLCLTLQYYGIYFSEQIPAYWKMQQRYPASLSDPNSFALIAILLAGNFIFSSQKIKIFAGSALLIAALTSGSRSLVLAIIIYIFAVLAKFKHKVLLSLSLVPLILGVLFFSPVALNRFVDTAKLNPAALLSKLSFNSVSYEIFKDHAITGIGFARYRDEIPNYKNKIDNKLGIWTDNANNFYFEQLVELGLFGILLWLFVLIGIQPERLKSKLVVSVFAVLLLFGSHLEFNEVAIVFSVILADTFILKPKFIPALITNILLVLILIFSMFKTIEYGIYPEEQDGTTTSEWTTSNFCTKLKCLNYQASLQFRVHPQNSGLKLAQLTDESFTSGQHQLVFKCEEELLICSNVTKTFIPGNNDYRKLGIQLIKAN